MQINNKQEGNKTQNNVWLQEVNHHSRECYWEKEADMAAAIMRSTMARNGILTQMWGWLFVGVYI
jgi:hypothetical protein